MKKHVTVEQTSIGWVVLDKNVQVGEPHQYEDRARLAAHHYSHAPSLQSQLKIKRINNERGLAYIGRPFWCVNVRIQKTSGDCPWALQVWVDDVERPVVFHASLKNALIAVVRIGREKVTTRNILNPQAGEFEIDRASKGGCCDPGTETYHCM